MILGKPSTMKFIVWGPDDIPIQEEPFASRPDAEHGIQEFMERFLSQGYYAGVGFQLRLEEIAGRCRIEEISDDASEWK
jgi:hypothetical protein